MRLNVVDDNDDRLNDAQNYISCIHCATILTPLLISKTSSRKIYAVPESQLKSGKGKHSRLQESDDDDELDYAPVCTRSRQQHAVLL